MQSFFETNEFQNLKKISKRIEEKATLRNILLFYKYSIICSELADTKFKRIGWDDNKARYNWSPKFSKRIKELYTDFEAENLIDKFGDDLNAMINYLGGGN